MFFCLLTRIIKALFVCDLEKNTQRGLLDLMSTMRRRTKAYKERLEKHLKGNNATVVWPESYLRPRQGRGTTGRHHRGSAVCCPPALTNCPASSRLSSFLFPQLNLFTPQLPVHKSHPFHNSSEQHPTHLRHTLPAEHHEELREE